MHHGFDAARSYIYANARLLERRIFENWFTRGSSAAVVAALAPYQNDDGGFGSGLEPDKRAVSSQPLDVEIAFERLVMVQANADDLVQSACDWLASIAAPSGAVPVLIEGFAEYPHASHWTAASYPPDTNPTAAIVACVRQLGISHPWADRAGAHCLAEIEADRLPDEAHALLAVTKLIEASPADARAESLSAKVSSALANASYMRHDPAREDYGLTPLDFAPSPTSLASDWFSTEVIEAHLDALQREQQPDGGWPIAWQPISEATRSEWRSIRTLLALRTLAAYGR